MIRFVRCTRLLTGLFVLTLAIGGSADFLQGQDQPAAPAAEPATTAEKAAEPKSPDARSPDARSPDARSPDARSPDEQSPAESAGEAAEELGSESESILSMILSSGATGVAFMAVLGLFSVVGVTVAAERAINMRRVNIMPPRFVDELESLTQQNAPPEAFVQLCSSSTGPMAAVLEAALLRQGRSLLEIEKSMEDAVAREMADLRAKIRPLSTVGSVAPLVGLLGTVVGMIIAFHTASQAGLGKAELLAEGIYMALLTTAGGLSVAIPTLLLSALFNGRLEKFIREMDLRLMPVIPCLARFEGLLVPQATSAPSPSVAEKTPPQAAQKAIEKPAAPPIEALAEKPRAQKQPESKPTSTNPLLAGEDLAPAAAVQLPATRTPQRQGAAESPQQPPQHPPQQLPQQPPQQPPQQEVSPGPEPASRQLQRTSGHRSRPASAAHRSGHNPLM